MTKPSRANKERPASAGHQHRHQEHVHAASRALTAVVTKLNSGKKQRPASAGQVDSRRRVGVAEPSIITNQSSSSSSSSSRIISSDEHNKRDIPRCKDYPGGGKNSSDGGRDVDDGGGESDRSSSRGISPGDKVGADCTVGAPNDSSRAAFCMPRAVEKVQVTQAHRGKRSNSSCANSSGGGSDIKSGERGMRTERGKVMLDRK